MACDKQKITKHDRFGIFRSHLDADERNSEG